ncbi:Pentatricopeptide repeat [Thalictrum thalictroides]|uniref:Pentatricopeptide repeat n=1 Tax=Thalictrum thalictroides TaxID=46969 RepID=A0A7J6XAS0_THATH|nr:Pentatricopeptide repeat [Thalictrum thalictroides]
MLLRSSSTPVFGSLLSSWSDSPKRDFDNNTNNKHSSSTPDHHHKKFYIFNGGHSNFSSYSCNSSPSIAGFSDLDLESNTKSLGGFRRAQSDGNLKGLITACDIDEFHSSKPRPRSSLRKPRHSMLQTIPSFSIYNSTTEFEEDKEGWGGEYSDKDGFLKRSITIGDNINGVGSGDFSFGKDMNSIVEEEGVSELHSFSNDEEGEPKSPPLYLARGLGLDVGYGGGEDGGAGDFGLPEHGDQGDHEKSNLEEYYKRMVEENPGNPLFLRNYAQFLYQSKGDLPRAEEYYSRAILAEPGDGDMLSQYAKIVWELHHDHERASNYFERAVQAAPEDSHVHAAYASFLWETEDEEEEDSFQQDLGAVPVFQSRVMASNGEFGEAVNLFDQMPHPDLFSYNTMITGLMKYGETISARQVFDLMPFKDVVSWNSMIGGYINNACMSEALLFFDRMPTRNVITWNLVMSGLANLGSFDLVEDHFRKMPERDVASWTIMISVLASVGRIVEARDFFEQIPEKDVRAWNAMLMGYAYNDKIEIAEVLFLNMHVKDSDSWNGLISGLVENQRIHDAVAFFTYMPQKSSRSWNSILSGLIRCGLTEQAHALFEKSPYNDIVTWTNMVIGYFELRKVGVATKLFELMPKRDATAWNATIFGLGENDHGEDGLKLYLRMIEDALCPDEATFTSVLTICSTLPSLDFGEQAHGQIIKSGSDSFTSVSNAVITMYARCGSMYSAMLAFSCMSSHDIVSWNSIICGYAHHGYGMEALKIFKRMRSVGVQLDQITFIGVLSACSHTGLVEQGRCYFDFMRYKCFIQPTCEHYTCMVDLLGRFGYIEEAMSFIKQMKEDGVEASASVWGALLGACRIHRNVKVGTLATEKVLDMDPFNVGIYIILAEMYMDDGRIQDSEKIMAQMKEKGLKKQPGCSWIEVNNSVHVFLAGDGSHPDFSEIRFALDLLTIDADIGFLSKHGILLPVGRI